MTELLAGLKSHVLSILSAGGKAIALRSYAYGYPPCPARFRVSTLFRAVVWLAITGVAVEDDGERVDIS